MSYLIKLSAIVLGQLIGFILAIIFMGILLMQCTPAHAAAIYVGSETKHWSPRPWYNDHHDLMGIESDSGYFAMTMVNSFYVRSFLMGKAWKINDNNYTRFGWKLGGVTGYDDWYRGTGMRVMPFVALTYTIGVFDFSLVPGATSLGLKWEY